VSSLQGLSLRERKKRRTRQAISDAATALFAQRGFDAVTIDEIAERAEVSKKTVFNYFACKEDLFFDEADAARARLLARVREREPGTPLIAAVREHVLAVLERMCVGDEPWIATMARLVSESESLRARQAEIYDGFADALAEVIAEETGAREGDARPLVAARAILGVERSVIDAAQDRVLAGAHGPALARSLKREAERGFDLLERGLAELGSR